MNKLYAVIYELRITHRDYASLHNAIKGLGNWWHHLPSTWLVYTTQTAAEIWRRLQPHIDQNDSMLIIEVGSDSQGWLPKTAWDWIKEYEKKASRGTDVTIGSSTGPN